MKMMASVTYSSSIFVVVSICAMLIVSISAAPMEPDDEPSENSLVAHDGNEIDMGGSWDDLNTAALRKLLLQLGAEDRLSLGRVGRSWPQAEPRGWSLRALDGRLARPWRADKRQVRFRQCYFNPISCFRK